MLHAARGCFEEKTKKVKILTILLVSTPPIFLGVRQIMIFIKALRTTNNVKVMTDLVCCGSSRGALRGNLSLCVRPRLWPVGGLERGIALAKGGPASIIS